jgi:5-formaminoimidazole-4-carboxamide-1-(beta)-D-ribofuranosyl 5'-monophosphate synthetase
MIKREDIVKVVEGFDLDDVRIGSVASHSALDVADGAVEEGFRTVLFAQKGREKTYSRYFKAVREKGRLVRGMVDECVVFDRFDQIMDEKEQEKIRKSNVLFVPNRALTSYVRIERVEDEFLVPFVGSRNLLRSEERGEGRDYYWLLDKAKLSYPERIKSPEDIDELVIVKLHHAKKKLERGFFTAASYGEYKEKSQQLVKQGVITGDLLEDARIERYVIGPVFNLNFFYSPLEEVAEDRIVGCGLEV